MKLFIYILPLLLFIQCSSPTAAPKHEEKYNINPGTWDLVFDISANDNKENTNDKIHIRFEVDSSQNITFINHTERITINDVRVMNGNIEFVSPQFNSVFKGIINSPIQFSGTWTNNYKDDYHIPFEANKVDNDFQNHSCKNIVQKKYDVTFSPNDNDGAYKAVGLFNTCNDGYCHGTFLTETGDYRFLEGVNKNNKVTLSCFDGSHLFLFTGEVKGDSIINGTFNSGKHWYEPWLAELNPTITLQDPDKLTYLKEGYESVEFSAQNLNGDTIIFDISTYKDKVTIIQIMGTWCPNCLDESLYFSKLFMKYHKQGLQIIPITFEASDDFKQNVYQVKKYFGKNHIPFQPYLGGKASKDVSAEKFNMLNHIMSFPTSIFIDKKGAVRKIHTGFYGPSTGEYYDEYKKETDNFIRDLLSE